LGLSISKHCNAAPPYKTANTADCGSHLAT
jgi:hypothetical protein